MQSPKCEIYTVYHKPDFLVDRWPFKPIHGGRAVVDMASKDGALKNWETEWLFEHMPGDDTGDNISHLNRYFSEISVLYWVWKNSAHLDDNDFIGLNHYRRLFAWSNLENIPNPRLLLHHLSDRELDLYCNPKDMEEILDYYDIIAPIPYHLQEPLSRAYKRNHDYSDFKFMLKQIKDNFPEYSMYADTYMNLSDCFFANISVMRKKIFMEYCELMFGVLEKLLEDVKSRNILEKKPRMFGYIAEAITGIFLYTHWKGKGSKIRFLPVLYPQHTIFQKDIEPVEGKIPVAIYFEPSLDFLYIVQLQALADNAKKSEYDVILYSMSDVPQNIKDKFAIFKDTAVSVRWYNFGKFLEEDGFGELNWRLSYPLALPLIFKNFKKIISLDPLALPLADLGELAETDLGDAFMAGAQDYSAIGMPRNLLPNPEEYFRDEVGLQNPFENYLQFWVSALNPAKMYEERLPHMLAPLLASSNLKFGITDAINLVCGGKLKKVDSAWSTQTWEGRRNALKNANHGMNWQYAKWKEDARKPRAIVYLAGLLPWEHPDSHLAEIWWEYARKTPCYEAILKKSWVAAMKSVLKAK